jgi:hypothetical protein
LSINKQQYQSDNQNTGAVIETLQMLLHEGVQCDGYA